MKVKSRKFRIWLISMLVTLVVFLAYLKLSSTAIISFKAPGDHPAFAEDDITKLQEQFDEFTIDYIDELIGNLKFGSTHQMVKDDLIYFSDSFN